MSSFTRADYAEVFHLAHYLYVNPDRTTARTVAVKLMAKIESVQGQQEWPRIMRRYLKYAQQSQNVIDMAALVDEHERERYLKPATIIKSP